MGIHVNTCIYIEQRSAKFAFQIMTVSEWYNFLQLSWTISLFFFFLEMCWDLYLAYFSLSLTNFFLEIRAIIIVPWKIVFFNFQWYILTSFDLDFNGINFILHIHSELESVKFLTFPKCPDFHSKPCRTEQNCNLQH